MDHLIVERGPIARVIINRPQVKNALSQALLRDMAGALADLGRDPEVRVIVLRGAGDEAFCAGADLKEVAAAQGGILEARRYFQGVADVVEAIARARQPVIAAVRGYALAGGCGIAAACDLVLAADDAVFGLPEINIGLFPMVVMAPIFRAVGRKKGLELIFTGKRIDAREAERIGLVNAVYPPDRLDAEVSALAEDLAGKSPAVLALGKEAFYGMADMEYFKSLRYLREMIAITASTEDAREGIASFFEKRKPEWRGR